MSSSIYDILDWQTNTAYKVNDIVRYSDGRFYYCKIANSDVAFTPSNWGGVISQPSETKPHFFWQPSYNSTSLSDPKVKSIKFGDGYEQRIPDGINNKLIVLDLTFEGRKQSETTAILHFLLERGGVESFVYTPPPPRAKAKRFVCKSWQDTYSFFDNYSIKAKFEEVPR